MKLAELGDALPKKGNACTRFLGRSVLSVLRWTIQGEFPNRPKLVTIIAPHTSYWDFIIGMAGKLALGLYANWLGKHTVFFWPLDVLLRWLGGIPVDRSSSHGTVEQVVELFGSREKLVLGLSPEGTRKRVEKWKTGFYHIALRAGVPIVPIYLDYAHKILGIGPMMIPTGDMERDLREMGTIYSHIRARYPEQFSSTLI